MTKPPKDPPPKTPGATTTVKTHVEFLAETGTYPHSVDTARVKALAGDLRLGDNTPPSGLDPYNGTKPVRDDFANKPKRRSLDDMRRLDAEIKARRQEMAGGKPGENPSKNGKGD